MIYDLPINYNLLSSNQRRQVREQYIEKQKGLCYFCNSSLKGDPPKDVLDKKITMSLFPDGFLMYPVHLHHDHYTGMTIGSVHAYCNAVLWEHYNE